VVGAVRVVSPVVVSPVGLPVVWRLVVGSLVGPLAGSLVGPRAARRLT
jgi:hypothetical protein